MRAKLRHRSTRWIDGVVNGCIDMFGDAEKGAWAVADVIMAKGYQDVEPATHALYGDVRSNLAGNEQRLFKDAGLINHHLFKPYNIND